MSLCAVIAPFGTPVRVANFGIEGYGYPIVKILREISRNQKEHVGGENKIRVEETRKWTQAAINISHGAAVNVAFFLLLLVIVFTHAGGHGITAGPGATKNTKIGKFPVGDEPIMHKTPGEMEMTMIYTRKLHFNKKMQF